jgi:predicted solute-binding protein
MQTGGLHNKPAPHPINLKLNTTAKYRIGAVGYLNTTPLVWGMLHGSQRELVDLSLSLPSECAEQVENGVTQIGLVPVAEVARQGLEIVPGVGIACLGAVRSILLFSRVPWPKVRTLAADASSRTSVQLARVILRERFGVEPRIAPHKPDLDEMLKHADAALIIGDPALRLDPDHVPYQWLDLGQEWFNLTQLPMVFAVWAGRERLPLHELSSLTRGSYEFGKARIAAIVAAESAGRGITRELAGAYLRRYIRFEIGAQEQRGLDSFFELAGLTEGAKL